MYKIEYAPDEALTAMVAEILNSPEFKELRAITDHDIVVLCCTKICMDEEGENKRWKGPPVKLKKIPDMERPFIADNAHYLLLVDYGFWVKTDRRQQMARIFDALMDIEPIMKQSGLKLCKRRPDVDFKHAATIRYFGAYDETSLSLREAYKDLGTRVSDFVQDIELPKLEEGAPEAEKNPKGKSKAKAETK